MAVSLVGSWAQEDDYGVNGLDWTPGGNAGTNRIAILIPGAEQDGSVQSGPMSVTSATLGGRDLNIEYNDQAGTDGGFHNTISFMWLDDAEIELMSGNTLAITWLNFDEVGPFETSPVVHYAVYKDVDQTTPNGASANNSSDANVNTLDPSATMNVAIDEKVIVIGLGGQPMDCTSSAGGLVLRTTYTGGENDMAMAVFDRTAVTADASYTWTVDLADGTGSRMLTYGIALAFDEVILTVEQDGFRFYEDGTESGAAVLEDQNVDLTIAKETIFGLRQGGQMVGDHIAVSVTIEYKKTGDADGEYRKLK